MKVVIFCGIFFLWIGYDQGFAANKPAIMDIVGLSLLLVAAHIKARSGRSAPYKPANILQSVTLGAFLVGFLVCALSSIVSSWIILGQVDLSRPIQIAQYLFVACALGVYAQRAFVVDMLDVLETVFLVLSPLLVAIAVQGDFLWYTPISWRYAGTFFDPNYAAAVYGIIFLGALASIAEYVRTRRSFFRMVKAVAAALLAAIFMIEASSRTAWIGLAGALTYLFAGSLGIVWVSTMVIPTIFVSSMSNIVEKTQQWLFGFDLFRADQGLNNRDVFLRYAYTLITENVWYGIPIERAQNVLVAFSGRGETSFHNFYATLGVLYGVPTLLLMILFIGWSVVILHHRWKLGCAMAIFLVIFENSITFSPFGFGLLNILLGFILMSGHRD